MILYLQFAHHTHDEFEEKNNLSPSEMLQEFDDYDWDAETERALELEKVAPTLSIESRSKDKLIWVSSVGSRGNLEFISECHFPGEVSAWFGFGKKLGVVSLETQTFSKSEARKALELFLNKDFDQLRKQYA